MKTSFLMGRIIVGAYFLYNGVNHFMNRAKFVGLTAAKGVPFPEIAIPISGALLLVAGLSFLLGGKPVLGIVAITLFLVPVSYYMHGFWQETGAARSADMINFTKNIALLGAAWMFAAIPRPWAAGVEAVHRTDDVPVANYPPRRTATG